MHPIKDILLEKGYSLTDSGEYWKTTAHYRDGKNPTSLSINKLTGRNSDFGNGKLNRSPEELVKLIDESAIIDFSSYRIPITFEKVKVMKIYPESTLQRLLPDFGFFLTSRSISPETMKTFGAGLAHSGKMNRRICFPIYDRTRRIIGFTGRWYHENLENPTIPKWKHIGTKTSFIYPNHLNEDIIREKKEIIVVESIGDVLALWEAGIKNAMCIFGISLSSKQLAYLIGLDCERIIVATNNDEIYSKGPEAAQTIKKKLAKFFSMEKIMVALPPKNDFGGMSKDEILKWYESTKW